MRPVWHVWILLLAGPVGLAVANPNVHVTYHWHQHQPIYWPETAPGTNRYQFAHDSIQLKLANTGNFYAGSTAKHPQNQLWNGDGGAYDDVFSKADRINAYQHGMRDSINTITGHPDAGASISYSGALQENIGSLGRASYGGYYPTWNSPTAEARGWTTSSGHPRADLLGMTYHHAFSPLLPESVLRKEIAIFREIWYKSWSGNPDKSDHSRGFWPIECAFSRHMIPVLREFGYEWSIVANSHLARTCQNYLTIAPSPSSSTWNNVPPNRADRLGPSVPSGQWWSGTIDGRGGTFPAPFAYQAHNAQYVHPDTGVVETLIVVPMCDQLSYQNGFGTMGTGEIDAEIAPHATDASHPCLVLMAHDGDNAWGGGNSYYFQSVPDLMNAASGQGYQPSTIEHYLGSFDTGSLGVVHVEDGSWVNADDRGSPGFYHWLFPPQRDRGSPEYDASDPRTWADHETPGFSEDFRSWAVVVAGANYLETAESLWETSGGTVLDWKIQEPSQTDGTSNNPNFVEQGWHYFLGGLDSGFLYYGSSLDDEMKPSLAQRRALEVPHAGGTLKDFVDARVSSESVPPTIFKPQRWPYNPGGMDWGNHVGYQAIGFNGADPWPSEFLVWSHIHDVAGVTAATLRVRVDGDGVNSLASTDNETYAGGPEVGAWIDIPMTRRTIDPASNPDSAPGDNPDDPGDINFFIQPAAIADYWYAHVDESVIPDIRSKLIDYYIVAVDGNGNEQSSEIQHVYVEDDGDPGGDAGDGGVVTGEDFVMDGAADSPGYLLASPGMTLYAAVRGDKLYVATWNPEAGNGNDHFILIGEAVLGAPATGAPWGKAGAIAQESGDPFLAAESTNSYLGWFNDGGAETETARGGPGGQMEGVIDMAGAFGLLPESLYLSAVAYQTDDGGALSAQAPDGNADGDVDAAEFFQVPLEAIRDEDANGIYDILDPRAGFRITSISRPGGNEVALTWNAFPGRSYHVQWWSASGWETVTAGPVVAAGLEAAWTHTGQSSPKGLYRVVLLD